MSTEVASCAVASWPRSTDSRTSAWWMLPLVVGWALCVGVGFFELYRYAATPGDDDAPPVVWPADSAIARDGRPTLLVFVHPMCPCSRATLSELERLLAACRNQADTHVLFIAPDPTGESWRDSALWAKATSIPGVTIGIDAQRREALRFGARTSGSCLLYGSDDRLLYHGGITAARGHEGESEGQRLLQTRLLHQDTPPNTRCVYGCPLFEDAPEP
jgi:hypothetical protein